MMWLLYELFLVIGLLCYVPKGLWRKRLPHPGWSMRLGRYPETVRRRLHGRRTIWVHAVSVGEVRAMQPLLERWVAGPTTSDTPSPALVVSTVTHTGFAVATRIVGERGAVVYGPLDVGMAVRRALRLLRPAILVLAESEFWPRLIHECRRQGVAVVVVNGRISARAFGRYGWVKPLLRPTLRSIDRFLMQSEVDAQRVLAMGAPLQRVSVVGSLKWDAGMLARPNPAHVEALRGRLGLGADEPVLVAGSTHGGEEEPVLAAYEAIRPAHAGLRVILAPRHPERADEVERLARLRGHTVLRASTPSAGPWNVLLVDGMGQLPVYYAMASVVFVGGSLIPHGGQNPIEPACLGKPVVFGPFMQNFADIVQRLLQERAACQVAAGDSLTDAIRRLLSDRTSAEAMGLRARALAERLSGTSQRTLDLLQPFLQ